jgi:DNA-directed RNA polymerase subunit M/transcription elongation factor TFIIS
MKFCDVCGSLMGTFIKGYQCPKCGEIHELDNIEYKVEKENRAEPVYVVKNTSNAVKVNRICPNCSHYEAYRRVIVSMGEHAGVNNDRSVERYQCIDCGHSWVVV